MKKPFFLFCLFILCFSLISFYKSKTVSSSNNYQNIISYTLDPKTQNLKFFWKNNSDVLYTNFKNLKNQLKLNHKTLVFAMNGGMFTKSLAPLGLYIENGIIKKPIIRVKKGYGNFYMQPNGIFAITHANDPIISTTDEFKNNSTIKFATQSGPMLVIEGKMHSIFKKGSTHLNIRNGVGILPNGHLIFAISKEKVNFYDFADYFMQKGCKNALYLDGFVSRAYIPSKKWNQLDGHFGVIIAEIK